MQAAWVVEVAKASPLRILKVFFPRGLAISEGVSSVETTIIEHTRPCEPPKLLNSLRPGERFILA